MWSTTMEMDSERRPSDRTDTGPGQGTILITASALARLAAEVRHLAEHAAVAMSPASDAESEPEAIMRARRLKTLTAALAAARVVDPDGSVIVGSSITLADPVGVRATYTLVAPGQAQPALGLISSDSPVGSALLGHRVGDRVVVDAPGGRWTVEVIDVALAP
jgi:transcription elongation factor GreA